MTKNQSKSFEDKGYEWMSKFCIRVGKRINKFGKWFLKQADNLRFERYKLEFGEQDEDIYITTFPKSGTTLMQVILYQLTTNGDMNFRHIYDVSPWIRNASFKNQKPIKLPSPRLIKTHDRYKKFPKGTKGRFIHVHREGKDTAISLYNQQKDYNKEDLKFETFLKDFFKNKNWFKYSKEWFINKKGFKILHVNYEDLLNNKLREIERLVNFLELDVDQKTINRAIKFSSFQYMKKHENKFGVQPEEISKNKKRYDNFIRKGKAGEGEKTFNEEQKVIFNSHYEKIVKPYIK